ncbi:MAG: phospholipase D-like domain-containing protein [Polyangiaceae bacterium]
MTILVAIPVYRISCKIGIDKARPWTLVDESFLWAVHRAPATIATLASRADVPRQIVVASLAQMMRFRLVEAAVGEDGEVAFRPSDYGSRIVSSGVSLPYFPKRSSRRVSFTLERATGHMYPTRDARPMSSAKLERERSAGVDVRVVAVEGAPPMSHEANVARLCSMVERMPDELLAYIDGHTSTLREDEYLVIRVVDGVLHGLPVGAGASLRAAVLKAAGGSSGTAPASVVYAGPAEDTTPCVVQCTIDPKDLIVGGQAHLECLTRLLESADRRAIIHSTFLKDERFGDLFEVFREACSRDVSIDILWGAGSKEDGEGRHHNEAVAVMKRISASPDTRGRIRVHMQPTSSHAKVVLVDTKEGDWLAALGSCNWLSSPFRAVEVSVVLRDAAAVAEVARAMQRLVGRQGGLVNPIANELAIVSRDQRKRGGRAGEALVTVMVGDDHDRLMRTASGKASRRMVIGSHRLGPTVRSSTILPGVAAARAGAKVHILYTMPSSTFKKADARELTPEVAAQGVRLTKTSIPLHAKFVAWDDDDVLITSLNWASADSNPNDPFGELGVHVHAPGIASELLQRVAALIPDLGLP